MASEGTIVTVEFDQNGGVTDFQTETRYGLEGPIDPPQGSWSYEQTVQACAAVTSTRSYVAAANASAALGAARFRGATGTNATTPPRKDVCLPWPGQSATSVGTVNGASALRS